MTFEKVPWWNLWKRLVGWGSDVRIYDPNVMLGRLRGRNLAYIDLHLPHLAQLLAPQLGAVLAHAELLVLTSDVADGLDLANGFKGEIIDLRLSLAKPIPIADRP